MKRNIGTKVAIGLILIVILILGGSIWFGYRKPQTVWQYTESRLGYGKPDADVAGKIVFLGDSIIGFENWNVLFGISNIANFGASGNTTDDVIARLDSAISAKPQKLFLMIGINDLLNGKDVAHVATNYETILNKIKSESPDTIIYAQSVLPVNNDVLKSETADNQKIIALNDKLKVLANERGIFFVDLYSAFSGADNKMRRGYAWDGLHPNSHGYAVWRDLIVQYIK